MRFLKVIIAGVLLINTAYAQTEEKFIEECYALQRNFNDPEALAVVENGLKKYPNSLELLANRSLLYSTLALHATTKENQKLYCKKADETADILIQKYPGESIAYTSKATAQGVVALTEPNKRKIDFAYEIKSYIDKALALNRNSAIAWHVLGRWSYEMASLSKTERFFAGILYRKIPESSMEDAIKYLYKSYTLQKDFVPNYLFLALAYNKTGKSKDAKNFTTRGLNLKPLVHNDVQVLSKIRELHATL